MRYLMVALVILSAAVASRAGGIGKVTVTTEQTPVMQGKEIVLTAKKGDTFDVTEVKGDWFGVAPSQGWIHKTNVRFEPINPATVPPPAALQTAPATGVPPAADQRLAAAPSSNKATPVNKPRITLEELRKRPKLGDSPYQSMEGFLKRMGTLGSTQVVSAWQNGFSKLGFPLVPYEIAIDNGYEGRLRGVFDDKNNLKADLLQHYLKRLPTITRKEFDSWEQALYTATGGVAMSAKTPWSIAYALVAVDPLYDASDVYVPQKAQRYFARLKGVKPQHVESFLKVYSGGSHYSDEVALSLAMVDEFFQNDQFDERLFQEVMAENTDVSIPLPSQPIEKNTPAGGAAPADEKTVLKAIADLEQMVAILRTVKDKDTATAAGPKLQAILKDGAVNGGKERVKDAELQKKYGDTTARLINDLQVEFKRIFSDANMAPILLPYLKDNLVNAY